MEKLSLHDFWIKFLNVMEIHGKDWSMYFLLAMMTIIYKAETRRVNNRVVLIPVMLLAFLLFLLTPQREDPQWRYNFGTRLINMLDYYRHQEVTERVDKVWALVGVLQKLDIELQLDGADLETIYRGFTRAIINWQGSLEIVTEANGFWDSSPSWVPDWSAPYRRLKYPQFTDLDQQKIENVNPWEFSDDGRQILVKARAVGKVQDICPLPSSNLIGFSPEEYPDDPERLCALIPVIQEWLENTSIKFGVDRRELIVFIFGGLNSNILHLLFEHDSISFCWDENELTHLVVGDKEYTAHSPGDWASDNWSKFSKNLRTIMYKACEILAYPKVLYISTIDEGRQLSLGFGPYGMAPADKVMILPTVNAPMILRKTDNGKFQVVGMAVEKPALFFRGSF
jgi:hypothetical protein